jgi:hypothetical protein
MFSHSHIVCRIFNVILIRLNAKRRGGSEAKDETRRLRREQVRRPEKESSATDVWDKFRKSIVRVDADWVR